MKTILFHPDQDRLKSIMTEAAGGFTQYVGPIERSVSQSEFVCVRERVRKLLCDLSNVFLSLSLQEGTLGRYRSVMYVFNTVSLTSALTLKTLKYLLTISQD